MIAVAVPVIDPGCINNIGCVGKVIRYSYSKAARYICAAYRDLCNGPGKLSGSIGYNTTLCAHQLRIGWYVIRDHYIGELYITCVAYMDGVRDLIAGPY